VPGAWLNQAVEPDDMQSRTATFGLRAFDRKRDRVTHWCPCLATGPRLNVVSGQGYSCGVRSLVAARSGHGDHQLAAAGKPEEVEGREGRRNA